MKQASSPSKFVLIKDLELYYQSMTQKAEKVHARVLGKIERFIPKQTIHNYVRDCPSSSQKDFWKALLSQSETQKKPEFDQIYGIITYNNELCLIEADHILMYSSVKEGNIYIFIGEVEEAKFDILNKVIMKPKIALKADNLNLQIFEQLLELFKADAPQ